MDEKNLILIDPSFDLNLKDVDINLKRKARLLSANRIALIHSITLTSLQIELARYIDGMKNLMEEINDNWNVVDVCNAIRKTTII